MGKYAFTGMDYSKAPRVQRKEQCEWHDHNATCPYCGGLTAYGAWEQSMTPEFRAANKSGDTSGISQEEWEEGDRLFDAMMATALYTLDDIVTRRNVSRAKAPNGSPYYQDLESTTRYYKQVCAACFAMEPAIAEALDEGWRFTKINLGQRCRCGRTKPVRAEHCPRCSQEYRMLESHLLAARMNRRMITQLRAAIKEMPYGSRPAR
jgi:NMD protein affecting ribosome stability and mRNA decay